MWSYYFNLVDDVEANQPESGQAGQGSPTVRSPSPGLLPGCLWAGRASSRGAPLQGLGPLLSDLGLEFCHQLVKVLASAHHLSSLVDGVDLWRWMQHTGVRVGHGLSESIQLLETKSRRSRKSFFSPLLRTT